MLPRGVCAGVCMCVCVQCSLDEETLVPALKQCYCTVSLAYYVCVITLLYSCQLLVIESFSTETHYILLISCRFHTASETHVGIKIVQTLAINLMTSTDPS